jgi:hypothetical protein
VLRRWPTRRLRLPELQASAACRWFGTQLECDLGGSQVLIGTQELAEPVYAGALTPQPLLRGFV